ncbi:efflux RND transporter periplasmic adaptor subunit [Dongia rigui]|uniref:Efflux RND transporter periplasmic adaptor subunit n=1 Tax=Dongia rigui TaxID=940149 RepID=A0ABU5DUP4_9PROT|nr:efflux RND transporter periplasmic adaptor subunit [Dongia rigui]MDY0870423.1 efflux RND transporter periplasmic adaptor subunit [Dongia rigui]
MNRPHKRSHTPRILALIAVIVLAGGVYWGRDHLPAGLMPASLLPSSAAAPIPGAAKAPPVTVYAAKAEAETLVRQSRSVGSLTASDTVTISPEIAGRIVSISDAQGGEVARGDVLAQLDTTIYQAQVAEADAKRKLWKANAERANNLMAKGAGTPKAVDEAASELGIAEAALNLAQANLAKARITAPFGGTLGLRMVSVGEYLTPGQAIFTLSRIDPLYVDFSVPQTELAVLREGTPVAINTDAFPGEQFGGKILAIDPKLDAAARAVSVRAEIANADGRLKPGLFIEVEINAGTIENAVVIPEQALVARGDRVFVYAIEDNKAVMKPVKTGLRQAGKVQIVEGLSIGETVVTDGQIKLRPGADVTIGQP